MIKKSYLFSPPPVGLTQLPTPTTTLLAIPRLDVHAVRKTAEQKRILYFRLAERVRDRIALLR